MAFHAASPTPPPDLSGYALRTDLAPLAKTADLAPLARKVDLPDVSGFALRSDIPALPDLTLFARKTDIPTPPDLTPYARKTDLPILPDLTPYAKKTDIPVLLLPGTFTIDTLPDPSTAQDLLAVVTDLFGVKRDKVLSTKIGSSWYWQPVRPDHTASVSANANITALPLKSPSFMLLTGTLTANRTITLATALAYPGAAFDFQFSGALGLNSLTIGGLALGATLSLVTSGRRRVFFDGTAWQQYL